MGGSYTSGSVEDPYAYNNGTLTDLGTLGGHQRYYQNRAHGINNFDQVVGWAYNAQGHYHAFLWSNSQMTDLGTLGGDSSEAFAINDQGQITGDSYLAQDSGLRAFLSSGGPMTDLGVLGQGKYSQGFGVNNSGVVVGWSNLTYTGSVYHAFVYSSSKMQDLNKLIPANSGWTLTAAYGINDAGQIVGYGTLNGQQRAFLLTPR